MGTTYVGGHVTAGDPGWDAEAVDTSTTDWTPTRATQFRSLYVSGAGDVTVTTMGGNNVTFKAVPAGSTLSQMGTKVIKATTTATLLVAYL